MFDFSFQTASESVIVWGQSRNTLFQHVYNQFLIRQKATFANSVEQMIKNHIGNSWINE